MGPGDVPEVVVERLYGPVDAFESICRYRDLLISRGIDWGLLGPREVDRIWSRHILNSAAVAELIPESATVADVGSGAGLPGIPVALLRPDLTVDLIEPLLRRSTFLTHSVDDLGITARVTVRRDRAERVHQTYQAVLSRALAPLDRLIRWCLPLMAPGGQILAIKGGSAGRELTDHARLITSSGLTADIVTPRASSEIEPTTVVRLRRS
ncbi:MAG TPA: 16S rRNA (guanine(527)-N(7))-methyltransferase RsmG [Microlunatus sp.]